MRIEIRSIGSKTTKDLREHVLRHLGSNLSRRADGISQVLVRLSDENGPKGGIDKCCHIEAILPGHPHQVVESMAGDFYSAITTATKRIGRSVNRTFDQTQRMAPQCLPPG